MGVERYGMWLALSSFIALAAHVDLGLTNGVVNAIAAAAARRDNRKSAEAVSTVFILLGAISCVVLLVAVTATPHLDIPRWLNLHSPEARFEAGPAVWVTICCFVLNMPLLVVQRVQIGYQEGFKANLWQILSSLATLLVTVWVARRHASLPLLVGVTAGLPIIVNACNTFYEFGFNRSWLWPSFRRFSQHAARQLAQSGLRLFFSGLAAVCVSQLPYLLLARLSGLGATAEYGVLYRLFSCTPIAVSLVAMPLWPAYREALESRDFRWILRTFRFSCLLIPAAAVASTLVVLWFHRELVGLWIGTGIDPHISTAVAVSALTMASSIRWVPWMYLNGSDRLGWQAFYQYPPLCVAALGAILKPRMYGIDSIVPLFALAEWSIVGLLILDAMTGIAGIRDVSAVSVPPAGYCVPEVGP